MLTHDGIRNSGAGVAASQPRLARQGIFRALLGSGDQAVILSCMIVSSAVREYFAR